MVMIPNPEKPSEAEEIMQSIAALYQCQVNGRWDIAALDRWLRRHPENIMHAAQRLEDRLNELFPPKEDSHERSASA